MEPRGLRNNNPLNIRRNGTQWRGLAKVQSDDSFFVFIAPEWGYRAALRTLQNYRRLRGLRRLQDWIKRWAPPCENHTEAYLNSVCRKCGIEACDEPDVADRETMCHLVAAMSLVENGVVAKMEDIYKGWELL